MRPGKLWIVLVVAAILGAACGRRGDGGETTATTRPASAPASDMCKGVPLEATEIGVTPTAITILVMADVGSPLAPGLFQGNIDAVTAFARRVNAQGGLACRKLVVKTWDSKLSAEEAKNGLIEACRSALAMVGSNALFNPDVSPIVNCPDKGGAPTGLPDVTALAVDVNQQCSPVTFPIQAVAEECPVRQGVRPLRAFVGHVRYFLRQVPDLHGIFQVPGDLPVRDVPDRRDGTGGRPVGRRCEGLRS